MIGMMGRAFDENHRSLLPDDWGGWVPCGGIRRRSARCLRPRTQGRHPAARAMVEKYPRLVNARNIHGETLLHFAAFGGDPGFIHFLIDSGAVSRSRRRPRQDAPSPRRDVRPPGRRGPPSSKGGPSSKPGTIIAGRPSSSARGSGGRRLSAGSSSRPGPTSTPKTSSDRMPSSSRPGGEKPNSSICFSTGAPGWPRAGKGGGSDYPWPPPTAWISCSHD